MSSWVVATKSNTIVYEGTHAQCNNYCRQAVRKGSCTGHLSIMTIEELEQKTKKAAGKIFTVVMSFGIESDCIPTLRCPHCNTEANYPTLKYGEIVNVRCKLCRRLFTIEVDDDRHKPTVAEKIHQIEEIIAELGCPEDHGYPNMANNGDCFGGDCLTCWAAAIRAKEEVGR